MNSQNNLNSSTTPPPTKRRRYNVGEVLYQQVETGENVDVVFLLGQNGHIRLKAHKNVLTGVSEVFASKLSERWGQVEKDLEGMGVIKLEENVTVQAATTFIKAMYIGTVDDNLELDKLLEVMALADKFLAKDVLPLCIDAVAKLIAKDTCIQIYEASYALNGCQKLVEQSLLCIKANLPEFLTQPSHPSTQWGAETWRKVLLMEGENMKDSLEVDIFRELIRWSKKNSVEEQELKKLVNLVRFPRMDAEAIARVVDPSGVLSDKETLDLLCYIIGGCSDGKRIPAFNTEPRCKKTARDTRELKMLLSVAQSGDFIQLVGTEYVGPFRFSVHKITIRGVGEATKFVSNTLDKILVGRTKDSRISNVNFEFPNDFVNTTLIGGLSIKGSRNFVSNVGFKNAILSVHGKNNRMDNLKFDGGKLGLRLIGKGSCNKVSNVTLSNLERGIVVTDKNHSNIIQDISMNDVKFGVKLEAKRNSIARVTYKGPLVNNDGHGILIEILGSYENNVDDVKIISGEAPEALDTEIPSLDNRLVSVVISVQGDKIPSYNTVSNCGPGGCVVVDGKNNVLKNVTATWSFKIYGCNHRLTDCTVPQNWYNGAYNMIFANYNLMN